MTDSLSDLIEAARASMGETMHTSLPGRVTSVNGNRVNVQPSLNRRLRDGRTENLPVIPNVPLWFPRGGGAAITWPVAVGDGCLLVFSERSLDEWKDGATSVTPDDPRRYGLSDAVALVGLDATASGSDVVEITMDGTRFAVGPEGVTATVGGVTLSLTASGLNITGGTVTHNGTNIGDTHTHDGVTPGAGVSGGPV